MIFVSAARTAGSSETPAGRGGADTGGTGTPGAPVDNGPPAILVPGNIETAFSNNTLAR